MRNWISKNSAFFTPVPRVLSTAEKVDDLYRDAARVLTNKNILNKNIDYACNALKNRSPSVPELLILTIKPHDWSDLTAV